MSRNAALFAVMCLVWGLTWLPVKVGSMHVPPVFLAAARFSIAGLLMLLWAGRDAPKVTAGAWPRLIGTALLLNTANYALLFWGTKHAPSGLAAIVNFATIPIYTLLASRAIEGVRIDGRKLAAIALGTVGLCFLFATRAMGGLSAAADPAPPVATGATRAIIATSGFRAAGGFAAMRLLVTTSAAAATPVMALMSATGYIRRVRGTAFIAFDFGTGFSVDQFQNGAA